MSVVGLHLGHGNARQGKATEGLILPARSGFWVTLP